MTEVFWEDSTHEHYAVLVSHGYGAAWSAWNSPRLAYDANVVRYWLAHKDDAPEQVNAWLEKNGYPNTYISRSNWNNLVLEWVPVNVYWRIREYDGAESVEILNLAGWNRFDKDGKPV